MKKIVVNRVMIRELCCMRRYVDKLNTDYSSCYHITFDVTEDEDYIIIKINTHQKILTSFDFDNFKKLVSKCSSKYLSFVSFEKGSFFLHIYYKKDSSFDTMLAVGK